MDRTEEKTMLKNHIRWARIKVKGLLEEIPRFVEVDDGVMVFSPNLVEALARYRRVKDDEPGFEVIVTSGRRRMTAWVAF